MRNGEGGFYLCQTMQNVYKSSPKIRIRWLDGGKVNENGARAYTLDFYDITDFECVLTTVDLEKVDGKVFELPKEEHARIESILKKAIDVEKGIVPRPTVTEENPDGCELLHLLSMNLFTNFRLPSSGLVALQRRSSIGEKFAAQTKARSEERKR